MSDTYPVPTDFAQRCHISKEQYQELYQRSITDPYAFWDEQAQAHLDWFSPFDQVYEGSFEEGRFHWFKNGTLKRLIQLYRSPPSRVRILNSHHLGRR